MRLTFYDVYMCTSMCDTTTSTLTSVIRQGVPAACTLSRLGVEPGNCMYNKSVRD